MFDADQVLFNHVWRTLPDSLSERRNVLAALRCKLTARHPAWTTVGAMISAIESIDELQAQLPFKQEGRP